VFFLGVLAPLAVERGRRYRTALVTVVFPIALLAMYLPWIVIDGWPYLRFLLPAYASVLAGAGTVLVEAASRMGRPVVAVAGIALVVFTAVHSWQAAHGAGVFRISEFDRRYARGVEIVRGLPREAVIVSNLHSGALRFYTGRDVLRFEVMPPEYFDQALAYLRDRGRPVYFVGDPDEVAYFDQLFRASRGAQAFRNGYSVTDGVVTYKFD
jgi:hypothetical protein